MGTQLPSASAANPCLTWLPQCADGSGGLGTPLARSASLALLCLLFTPHGPVGSGPCEAACAAPRPAASRPNAIGQAPGSGLASALCLPHRPPRQPCWPLGCRCTGVGPSREAFRCLLPTYPMGPLPCVPGQPGPEEAAPDLVLWIWADLGAPWEMMLGSGPSGDLIRCFQM